LPRYAVPLTLLVGTAVAAAQGAMDWQRIGGAWAAPVWTSPTFSAQALVGLALPLFIVTMASQNLPGVAAQRAAGYDTPVSPPLVATGLTGVLLAPFGGYAFNLAAITAAICMGREAGDDPARRYTAAVAAGLFYGLAGLRIGYAFATPRAMRLLERLEHLFCISSLAEAAAVAALEDEAHASATHELLRTEKARMTRVLGEGGLACVPSEVHFMLVQCPTAPADAEHVWAAFIDAGIIVPMGLMYDRYLMLPVLTPAQNDRHMQILLDLATQHRAGSGAAP
jgi:hypothetical protein